MFCQLHLRPVALSPESQTAMVSKLPISHLNTSRAFVLSTMRTEAEREAALTRRQTIDSVFLFMSGF
jgi:hypothetical protein